MRAIVQDRYGSPDLLRLAEIDRPSVTDDGVLVRVRASSVNAFDWRRVRGAPLLMRVTEGWRRPKTPGLGGDAAGEVVEVGRNVTHVSVGDRVFGVRTGAFSEHVNGRTFVRMPDGHTFEQAAAVPIAGITALQALRDQGGLQPGQSVLINGAGGGVGSFAVQIARALGGDVTAVTGPRTVDMVRSLGADRVIDHQAEDFTRLGRRHDLVVDIGGNRSIRHLRRVLAPNGMLVLVGAGKGRLGPMTRFIGGGIRTRFLHQRMKVFIAQLSREDLVTLAELVEAGKIIPPIDRTYPLEQVPDAIRYVEEGHARGKVVITI